MDKDQVAPPNYGEVKFPRLVGGVISRPFDRGLRVLAAVRTFESSAGSAIVWMSGCRNTLRRRGIATSIMLHVKKTLTSIVTC